MELWAGRYVLLCAHWGTDAVSVLSGRGGPPGRPGGVRRRRACPGGPRLRVVVLLAHLVTRAVVGIRGRSAGPWRCGGGWRSTRGCAAWRHRHIVQAVAAARVGRAASGRQDHNACAPRSGGDRTPAACRREPAAPTSCTGPESWGQVMPSDTRRKAHRERASST
jgi:hypothetical protein